MFIILLSEVPASLASTAQLDHRFRFPAHQAPFALLPTLQLLQANALRVTTVLKVQVVLLRFVRLDTTALLAHLDRFLAQLAPTTQQPDSIRFRIVQPALKVTTVPTLHSALCRHLHLLTNAQLVSTALREAELQRPRFVL